MSSADQVGAVRAEQNGQRGRGEHDEQGGRGEQDELTAARGNLRAPGPRERLLELLWPVEAAGFVASMPLLLAGGLGDGHPVLVLPGFTAGDASTVPLRWLVRSQGYYTHPWRLGQNIGPTSKIVTGLRDRLEEVAGRRGRTVSLIGWSLGGIYARELARERPQLVRQVITLGSPYRMVEGDRSTAQPIWRRLEHLHDGDLDVGRIAEQHRPPLSVPATSIYSRRDGVARWQTCIDEVGPLSENIEVLGSHVALGFHPAVAYAVLDRLRQPEGEWRRFRPPPPLWPWYPRPVSWKPNPRRRRRQLVVVA